MAPSFLAKVWIASTVMAAASVDVPHCSAASANEIQGQCMLQLQQQQRRQVPNKQDLEGYEPDLDQKAALPEEDERASSTYTRVAVQQRMHGKDATFTLNKACPHKQANLRSFSSLLAGKKDGANVKVSTGKWLFGSSAEIGKLTIGENAEVIFDDKAGLWLKARSILVKGKLLLGSPTCPLLAAEPVGIMLMSPRRDGRLTNEDAIEVKGIVVERGGALDMFGRPEAPTWTRLQKTYVKGEKTITLQEGVTWRRGQKILVTTTSYDDSAHGHQNEIREIKAVAGKTITLDGPLDYGHYAGPEYAAEVALLTRNILIEGDGASALKKHGGHTLCTQGSQCRIRFARAVRMGATNMLRRYPFHLHLMGDVQGESYFMDNVVTNSYFRAFTIHGTSSAKVYRNVAYNIVGSAYYLEDGIEEKNEFKFNLAAHIHVIKPASSYEGGQDGIEVEGNQERIIPTDVTAVGFYCTNARNRWVGNSASGGWAGFAFPALPRVLGPSLGGNEGYSPESQPLLEFDSNTAHSSGNMWKDHGACIYVGGRLWSKNGKLTYRTGRFMPAREGGDFLLANTKVFACNKGVLFWGSRTQPGIQMSNFEAADINQAAFRALGTASLNKAVITARTNNKAGDLPSRCNGALELYDTSMQTIFTGVTFRNFQRTGDACVKDLTGSNSMKHQGMVTFSKMKWEGVDYNKRFLHVWSKACKAPHADKCEACTGVCAGTSGSSQSSNILDDDGSTVGAQGVFAKGVLLGAGDSEEATAGATNEWWHLEDRCEEKTWGFWACPRRGHRTVVSIWLVGQITPEVPAWFSASSAKYNPRVDPQSLGGKIYHFKRSQRYITMGLAGSPQITGPCCDIGWYYDPEGAVPRKMTIYLDQMVPATSSQPKHGLVFAMSYPQGARLTVKRCLPTCVKLEPANSLTRVLQSTGQKYFVDNAGRLFLKLVDTTNTERFEVAGSQVLASGNHKKGGSGNRYTVSSNRGGRVQRNIPGALPSWFVRSLA